MRIDRRQFIWIGAAGALAASGCKREPEPNSSSAPPAIVPAAGVDLQVDFEGLYIIEGKGASTRIHMIDGAKVGVPTHTLQMEAMQSAIDTTKTATPDAAHVVPAGSDFRWLWDLQGNAVTMPKADSGPDVLTSDDTSSDDKLETPASEPGWHSLARVPDLGQLCGATMVSDLSKVASTVALKHGHLTVLQPSGVGQTSVWKFVKSDGTELTPPGHKALSNKVRYIRPNKGNQLMIEVGSQKIYFKPGVSTQVVITNVMPLSPTGCPAPCTPNMDHFTAFLKVVDSKNDAKAVLVSFTPPVSALAEPDYCPGSRV